MLICIFEYNKKQKQMEIKITHTGGFARDAQGNLTRALYYPSKWEKEIGDKITVDGYTTAIEVIGKDRNDTIDQMNEIINEHNRKIKQQRIK